MHFLRRINFLSFFAYRKSPHKTALNVIPRALKSRVCARPWHLPLLGVGGVTMVVEVDFVLLRVRHGGVSRRVETDATKAMLTSPSTAPVVAVFACNKCICLSPLLILTACMKIFHWRRPLAGREWIERGRGRGKTPSAYRCEVCSICLSDELCVKFL